MKLVNLPYLVKIFLFVNVDNDNNKNMLNTIAVAPIR